MASTIDLGQRLTSGIYGRLEYDFACNRGHAFSEAHLHGAIMDILAANVLARTHDIRPGFAIPELQDKTGKKAGRNREVDFAILDRESKQSTVCIEAKWSGSSHASEENILIDLARLATINYESPSTVCLFIFAGGKSAIEKRLSKGLFSPHGSRHKPKRLLRYPYDGKNNNYPLSDGIGESSVLSKSRFLKISRRLPSVAPRIRSHLYKPSHLSPPNWSVQVWRVWGNRR